MLVSKWGNSLAVRLPKEMAERMGIKEGDDLTAVENADQTLTLRKNDDRQKRKLEALRQLAALARPLPPGYRFDRGEIYDRQPEFGERDQPELDNKP